MSHPLVQDGEPLSEGSDQTHAGAAARRAVSLEYRPDIDGLRGVAVLLVIAFHYGVWPFTGGYIGVDIFFVISGFLITSLLCRYTTALGPALDDFYRRRIIRLMPMFLVVAFATAVAVSFLFVPDDFINFFQSLGQGLLVLANVHFDHAIHDYFSHDAHELPLLHIWSLSIEWQFYLLFPVFFLAARRHLSQRSLMAGLAGLMLAFLAVSVWKTGSSQQSYFSGPARYFEPLIGCVAAFVSVTMRQSYRRAVVAAGTVGLIGLAVGYSNTTGFPGFHAALVCVLAAAIVVCGKDDALLSVRPLVHIGRISYSAYLWHWPPLALLAYMQVSLSGPLTCVLFFCVLALAHLSYVLIEKRSQGLRAFPLWKLVALFFLLPLAITYSVKEISKRNDGFYQRLGAEAVSIHRALAPYADRGTCMADHRGGECRLGDPKADVSFYLLGDSHAGHYRRFVDVLAKDAGVAGVSYVMSSCLAVPGIANVGADEVCRRTLPGIYEKIFKERPAYVLIAERWIGHPMKDVRKLDGVLASLVKNNITPVFLGPVPEDGKNLKSCFYRHVKLRKPYEGECVFDADNGFDRDGKKQVSDFFAEMKAKYPTLIVIDVQAVACTSGRCAAQIDGAPIYNDTNHLTPYGSAMLASRYLSRFGNPLRR